MASLLELAGFCAIVYGTWLLAEWMAWIVGGVLLALVGYVIETGKPR